MVFFTDGGNQLEVLDEVVERLDAAHNKELASLAFLLASLGRVCKAHEVRNEELKRLS